jgi:predicted ATPase
MAESPETVETQPALMAHHLAQAGLTEKAIEFLRKARQRAIEHSANAEAIEHLTRVHELPQSLSEKSLSEYQARKPAAFGLEVIQVA